MYSINKDYAVTETGDVISIRKGIVLKTCSANTGGYETVMLGRKGGIRYVHRLVAEAFIPNPDNLPDVNHINEDKSDNRVENLEWCTRQYNVEYSQAGRYTVVSPEGVVTDVFNMRKFCRDHDLNQGAMSLLVAGKRSHHKGWKLCIQ